MMPDEFDTMAEELKRAAKHEEWVRLHPDEPDPDVYDITPCITWDTPEHGEVNDDKNS